MPSFDPEFPTTENSMNRIPIVDLPGYSLPDHLKGTTGYQLVSTFALDNLLADSELSIAAESPEESRSLFYHRLERGDRAAEAIAREMGRRFGLLLLTLKRGDPVNREARGEWSESHWDYWTSVEQVIIGGGLVSGRMGTIMAQEAAQIVQSAAPDYRVEVAAHPQHLPLLGAARYVTSGDVAYMFDFGGSFVKRGRAHYADSQLQSVIVLPSLPVLWHDDDTPERILDEMTNVIALTCDESHRPPLIPISIASYVDRAGNPLLSQGGTYMTLRHLSEDIPALMGEHLSSALGCSVRVKLLHDGTSAASFYSPLQNAAVIMIGTAMGVGFPVDRPYLCDVSEQFQLIHEEE